LVSRNQLELIRRKQSGRKKEKNVSPVTGRFVIIYKKEGSQRLCKYRKMPR